MLMNKDYFQMKQEQATAYFQILQAQIQQENFALTLVETLHHYQQSKRKTWLNVDNWKHQPGKTFIFQLAKTGQLDSYLERSISYIYFRDLGRDITSEAMQKRIAVVTEGVKNYLNNKEQQVPFHVTELYQMAEKESLEEVFFWVSDKLKHVSAILPDGLDKNEAKRKIMKIIAGIVMHEFEELDDGLSKETRRKLLDQAVRTGYYYGLTYPLIDDVLDADMLTAAEKKSFAYFIQQTLLTGEVLPVKADDWQNKHWDFISAVHEELSEAFYYLKSCQPEENRQIFLENAYLFFEAQELDRQKRLDNNNYTNEELYTSVILKSASSRLIIRSFKPFSEVENIETNMFYYGIYNQLADDLTDLEEDLANNNVTPYTYFVTYSKQNTGLINPFAMYWSVIYYFIHKLYPGKTEIRDIILDRAINGLKRLKARLGKERYQAFKEQFSFDADFDKALEKIVNRSHNVAFFDKWIRDQFLDTLKQNKQLKIQFIAKMKAIKEPLEEHLTFESKGNALKEAANYSLSGHAKRLRPIMTWIMAKEGLQLPDNVILPLAKSVEFMHTASLIFDDLPSQDNAFARRGKHTLHEKYNHATAELTGLWLTQRAVEEQAAIRHQDSNRLLELIAYSTRTTQKMCQGQFFDLHAKGSSITLGELRQLSVYKTGLGFEAALMMPLIIAGESDERKQAVKELAYHAGIAFQIKDDLLDITGDAKLLGKHPGQDQRNNSSTFVSILGKEEAQKEMWKHYLEARKELAKLPDIPFFYQLLDYLILRDH
ncbi:polyprenyl synthetase family protein [Oceanobacillus sojae]|uniref:polyprenyl synthetase family protein n=1 Tax=Oceanobacillus sojae TaxID=582851 RepID=UPI0021A2D851|nr:polyprenyl synthetase family protein [Oceanobacillus sojae]MCT1904381.1 polyprenyl synthetase family protein [Oceanobacillus sojae]